MFTGLLMICRFFKRTKDVHWYGLQMNRTRTVW